MPDQTDIPLPCPHLGPDIQVKVNATGEVVAVICGDCGQDVVKANK